MGYEHQPKFESIDPPSVDQFPYPTGQEYLDAVAAHDAGWAETARQVGLDPATGAFVPMSDTARPESYDGYGQKTFRGL